MQVNPNLPQNFCEVFCDLQSQPVNWFKPFNISRHCSGSKRKLPIPTKTIDIPYSISRHCQLQGCCICSIRCRGYYLFHQAILHVQRCSDNSRAATNQGWRLIEQIRYHDLYNMRGRYICA